MLVTEKPLINLSSHQFHGLDVPDILPNEYLLGFFGRIAILNHFESVTKLHMFLARQTHQNIARKTPILMCVSSLLEIDPIELWRNHTAYDFKMKNCNSESIREKLRTSHYSTRNFSHQNGTTSAFFCTDCVDDDFKKLGHSFWKRKHQTRESEYCKIHQNQKLYMAVGNERLYFSPGWHIENNMFKIN